MLFMINHPFTKKIFLFIKIDFIQQAFIVVKRCMRLTGMNKEVSSLGIDEA